ncbi:hypothetical protein IWW36_000232 [Coemansia brasiliensis]|uniref:Pentatricopeptide repeat-containing protein n=1 Tax=Coemansia brasiliensis TaxID=2650707 RepID=A0A9W8M092_9FUNG|nr:hypothetical protein IWW36_000232 [Coemansia brasiliensis]
MNTRPAEARGRRGRVNRTLGRQYDTLSSRIQMLSLALEYRQYKTIRLPRIHGSLPVIPITALTLWGRAIHSLLGYVPHERVTSAVPLLKQRSFCLSTDESNIKDNIRAITELSAFPDTIMEAFELYRKSIAHLTMQSAVPWLLVARSREFNAMGKLVDAHIQSMLSFHGYTQVELLLNAYLRLCWEQQLRKMVVDICNYEEVLDTMTLAQVLAELQNTDEDRQIASRLWNNQLSQKNFVPSQTCIHLALKAALHSRNVSLAIRTYEDVLKKRWPAIRSGFWIHKLMVYGLATNRYVSEAFEVADAAVNKCKHGIQVAQIFELLLRGLRRSRQADSAVAVMKHVRTIMRPTISMYVEMISTLAREYGQEAAMNCVEDMRADGYTVPAVIWERMMLGLARRGDVEGCDYALAQMGALGEAPTYTVVQAAIDAYAQRGDIEMLFEWAKVVLGAMKHHTTLNLDDKQSARFGNSPSRGIGAYRGVLSQKFSLERPHEFLSVFIDRNEIVWHNLVVVSLISAVGQYGTGEQVLTLWKRIHGYSRQITTLCIIPVMVMALARALEWHGLLQKHRKFVMSHAYNPRNGFKYCQKREVELFVAKCEGGDPAALCPPRVRPVNDSPADTAGDIDRGQGYDNINGEEEHFESVAIIDDD